MQTTLPATRQTVPSGLKRETGVHAPRDIRISDTVRRGDRDAEPFKRMRLMPVPHNLADYTFYKNTIIR